MSIIEKLLAAASGAASVIVTRASPSKMISGSREALEAQTRTDGERYRQLKRTTKDGVGDE